MHVLFFMGVLQIGKVKEVEGLAFSASVVSAVPDDEQPSLPDAEQASFRKQLVSFFEKSLPGLNADLVMSSPPGSLCDAIASGWSSYQDQLRVLAAVNLSDRMRLTIGLINQSKSKASSSAVAPSLSSSSKKDENEMDKLRRKLENAQIPQEQREEIFKDFAKLQRMQKSSSEYEYVLSFLEFAARLVLVKGAVLCIFCLIVILSQSSLVGKHRGQTVDCWSEEAAG